MSLPRMKPLVIILLLLSVLILPKTSLAGKPLVLCVHPYMPATEITKRFSPLAHYLGMVIGKPVTLMVANSYEEHIKLIGSNKVDIAFLGPSSYVILTARHGARGDLLKKLFVKSP